LDKSVSGTPLRTYRFDEFKPLEVEHNKVEIVKGKRFLMLASGHYESLLAKAFFDYGDRRSNMISFIEDSLNFLMKTNAVDGLLSKEHWPIDRVQKVYLMILIKNTPSEFYFLVLFGPSYTKQILEESMKSKSLMRLVSDRSPRVVQVRRVTYFLLIFSRLINVCL